MDNAVEVSKAFRKFVFLMVLSALLGSILQQTAQAILDKKWSIFARSLQEKKIVAHRPQVVFSRNGIPTLGAAIDALSYETVSQCFKARLEAENLFLSLKLFSLLRLKPELGTLSVETTRLNFHEIKNCQHVKDEKSLEPKDFVDVISPPKDTESPGGVSVSAPPIFHHLHRWFTTHFPKRDRMPLRHFVLDALEIQGQTQKEKKVQGQGKLVVHLEDQLSAELIFEPLVLGKVNRSVSTHFRSQLTADQESIRLRGDWAYYEGHLVADLEYRKDETVRLDVRSQNLPLSVLNRWFETPWTFQFLWFNCGLELKATAKTWSESPWNMKECSIAGPYGHVQISSQKTRTLEKVDHLDVKVKDLQLDRIFKGKEQIPLSGVWKDFGVLQGDLTVQGENIKSDWTVEKSSVIFSRNNKRELQVIETLSGHFEHAQGVDSLAVTSATLRDGQFSGRIDLTYEKALQRLHTSVQLSSLQLAPAVQTLMWSGQVSPFKVDGDMSYQKAADSASDLWTGQWRAQIESYKSANVEAQKISALLGWEQGLPQVALSAESALVDHSESTQWIFASLLQEAEARKTLRFQQVYLKGLLRDKNEFTLQKSTALFPGIGRLHILGVLKPTEGKGTAQWQLYRGPRLDWEWTYRPQDILWIPQSKSMRDWVAENPDFLREYPFIR